jgi:hypothetical protein
MQCTCGYGAGGSCDQHLPNGASDPEDCDQAGHVCWNGACLLEEDESCDTSDQCVSDSCLNGVCLPYVCDDAAMAANPYSGSGTVEDPYLLCTAQQLQSIQAAHLDAVFYLGRDIDLSGYDGQGGNPAFVPIGPSFTGTFDGRGYDIVNLTSQAGGLFDVLSGNGIIRNLNLIAAQVTGTAEYLGMLANTMDLASTRIELCQINGQITGVDRVGGMVGFCEGALQDCHATGTVVASDPGGIGAYAIGGLVGRASSYAVIHDCSTSDAPVVADCYATGQVTCVRACGGLVGTNARDIYRSYATGQVSGQTSTLAGGLVGENVGNIYDSFAVGLVVGVTSPNGYGIAENSSGSMLNCFWYDANPADSAWECNNDGNPAGVCEKVAELNVLFDAGHALFTRTDGAWDFTNHWLSHSDALPTLRP